MAHGPAHVSRDVYCHVKTLISYRIALYFQGANFSRLPESKFQGSILIQPRPQESGEWPSVLKGWFVSIERLDTHAL